MLEVHGGLLAWTVITFVLLLVVLKKVAWGPILDALDARENEIKDALNAAEKAREEAERVSSDYEDAIRKAQADAQQIISDAKTAGEKVKLDLEAIASEKADEIIEKAKAQIDAERVKVISEIKTVAVEISLSAAAKVIEKNLDSDDNRKLVNEALEGIGQA
ncbi:MAG: F0F1 ATP synthase subunit B [Candidatus Marinimicrobia bacterium]|jgi:F-type H+-transporting ATPase subunit b|nr:F0F1 ATP synthase subunit B [Candidatus Neomarinimicrobiota bacterium]|tara:strand:+ start:2893 stop:3378 length:486 start_codon:yes stop_codon:yes gene_type:complete